MHIASKVSEQVHMVNRGFKSYIQHIICVDIRRSWLSSCAQAEAQDIVTTSISFMSTRPTRGFKSAVDDVVGVHRGYV